ncbi:hypothetical protein K443DRAFT_359348 [Laccaria amethystina LaAM-08-1]|uniref:Uncharacterized protein n=1 Tax=Laccaria amethystina LaAM-08-1 TaxID=1095629 RepID=A0A0C9YB16_9AGAR|nr:hypothetical protein K443DRAFT_359348 [Laccaria amethystina LaAM-08-1]
MRHVLSYYWRTEQLRYGIMKSTHYLPSPHRPLRINARSPLNPTLYRPFVMSCSRLTCGNIEPTAAFEEPDSLLTIPDEQHRGSSYCRSM